MHVYICLYHSPNLDTFAWTKTVFVVLVFVGFFRVWVWGFLVSWDYFIQEMSRSFSSRSTYVLLKKTLVVGQTWRYSCTNIYLENYHKWTEWLAGYILVPKSSLATDDLPVPLFSLAVLCWDVWWVRHGTGIIQWEKGSGTEHEHGAV